MLAAAGQEGRGLSRVGLCEESDTSSLSLVSWGLIGFRSLGSFIEGYFIDSLLRTAALGHLLKLGTHRKATDQD